uniref:TIGR02117 family protein n=1 Tax=Thaumasiovibrio occultus TaxID=1891184 RepID=UPI000B34DBB6|nr:TIGR02117 family protein [Thaumasiovibrio occultus]
MERALERSSPWVKQLIKVSGLMLGLSMLGCSVQPASIEPAEVYTGTGETTIYLNSNDWHTGIIVPAELMHARIPQLQRRFPDSPRLEFGWGDKGFYEAEQVTSGISARALFTPTTAVMHVVAVPDDVVDYFHHNQILAVPLNATELEQLLIFLTQSFTYDAQGKVIATRDGIYGDSQFYQAQGNYYFMNTCNTWTARGMSSIGMTFSPLFKLTAGSVMDAVDDENGVVTLQELVETPD